MEFNPYLFGKLVQHVVSEALLDETTNKPVVIYSGRFQPFHAGHYSVYKSLVDKYGADRVFIVSSDKTDPEKSPLSFDEKKVVMTKMFGIDPNKIVKARSPYAPAELLQQFDPQTPAIFAVSEKDSDRLKSGKYFVPYTGTNGGLESYRDRGYYDIVPEFQMNVGGQNISGTAIRQIFSSNNEDAKKMLFTKIYGKFDEDVYALLNDKFQPAAPKTNAQVITPPKTVNQPAPQSVQDPNDKLRLQSLMRDKIRNPETDNDIFVGTALKYDKSHPAYRAAQQYVKSRMTNESKLITEGGAAGHLQHPYEDMSLTFADLKELVHRALVGGLDADGPVAEKADGQNLMFSFKNGRVVFARNKGHIRGYGQNALGTDQLSQFFSGKGEIEDSFGSAARDIEAAIMFLSDAERDKIFMDGKKFMNMEVINPSAKSAIPYKKAVILFHGSVEFDETGTALQFNREEGEVLATALQKVNAHKQKTYGLQGQNYIVFSDEDSEKFVEKAQQYSSELDKIASSVGMGSDSTIGQYMATQWANYIKNSNVQLSPEELSGVIRRWATGDKSFGIKHIAPEHREWFKQTDVASKQLNDKFITPIKLLVLKMGADSISRVTNALESNNPHAAEEMKLSIQSAMQSIRQSGGDLDALEKHLDLLTQIGMDKISSIEGMVFNYKGGVYKLTGAFAPYNQIYGRAKYGTPKTEPTNSPEEQPTATEPTRTIAPQKQLRAKAGDVMNMMIMNPVTQNNIKVRSALNYPPDHPAHKLASQILKRRG